MIRVTFFQRKRRPGRNFSLEQIFDDIRRQLATEIEATTWVAPYFSGGLIRRLLIGLSAFRNRGEINHVTGDINFVTAFLPRRQTILTILDLGVLANLKGIKHWLVWLFWFQIPVNRSAVVTVISEATRQSLLQSVRCDPERVVVVPVAITPDFAPSAKDFDKENPVILQVGTNPNKNLLRVAEALNGIRCRLQIIGPLDNEQKNCLEANGIAYTSWENLSQDQVVAKYQHCDMVLFASTFEGFGMPILEANATGRVVITSNITSMPEVASNAAILVDPYDVESIRAAVKLVIEDDNHRAELIANGYRNVRRYNSLEIAKKYLSLYKQLHGLSQ